MNEAVISLPFNLLDRIARALAPHTTIGDRYYSFYLSPKYVASTNGQSAAIWSPDPDAFTSTADDTATFTHWNFHGDPVAINPKQLLDGCAHVAKLYMGMYKKCRRRTMIADTATIVTNQSFFSVSIGDLSSSGATIRSDDFPVSALESYLKPSVATEVPTYRKTGWMPRLLSNVAESLAAYAPDSPAAHEWTSHVNASFFSQTDHEGRLLVLAMPARL